MKKTNNISVIGAGTMGPGIAMVFAVNGYSVHLWTRSPETLDKSRKVVRANLETFVDNDLLKASEIDGIEANIIFTNSLEDSARDADMVIETIIEKIEEKKALFAKLDRLCPEDTIFTSNTSYLNIFEVMPANRLPKTVIAHWFAPPHILPLVEVVRGTGSSDETVEAVQDILKKAGKIPVVMEKFVPGFAINRILRILGREIFFLLDNGYITADQLDLAVKASIAPRMMLLGLVQRYDFTGLDLSAGNLRNTSFLEPPVDNEPRSLFSLVEKGDLGVKSGRGFYDYTDRKLEDTLKQRDNYLLKIFKNTDFCLRETIGKKYQEEQICR